jgi:hypothetical protein
MPVIRSSQALFKLSELNSVRMYSKRPRRARGYFLRYSTFSNWLVFFPTQWNKMPITQKYRNQLRCFTYYIHLTSTALYLYSKKKAPMKTFNFISSDDTIIGWPERMEKVKYEFQISIGYPQETVCNGFWVGQNPVAGVLRTQWWVQQNRYKSLD